MNFADGLRNELNITQTGNGATTYKSSLDSNLDLFYQAGGIRGNNYYADISTSVDDLIILLKKAYAESPELALRNLLNIRDFRHDGKGERDLFIELLNSLIPEHSEVVTKLIDTGVVQELGRWDDLVKLFAKQQGLQSEGSYFVETAIADQFWTELGILKEDANYTSLLPKWLPTNTRNIEVYKVAKELAHFLGYKDFRSYRKEISSFRKRLNLVESNLSQKNYGNIEVSQVPSHAFKKYSRALWKYKESQMNAYMKAVDSGEAKMKTVGLTPDEIVHSISESDPDENTDAINERLWKEMVANTTDVDNTLVMADTSGSMTGKPMDVAVGLALLFARAMSGSFHNKFMTFSESPSLMDIPERMTLRESIDYIWHTPWGFNTNINAALDTILVTAIKGGYKQEDLPKRLVIISDMQFDVSTYNYKPNVKHWKQAFKDNGYTLPEIIYWNVSSYSNAPAVGTEKDVALISGFTPGTLNAVMNAEDVTPLSVMKEALLRKEYDDVLKVLN